MISLDLPTGVFSFSLNSSNEYKISGSLNLANIIAEIPQESDSNYKRVTPTYYYSIYINKNNEQTNLLWSGDETELTNDTIDFEERKIQSLLNDGIKQTIYVNIDVKTQFTHIYFTSNTISFLAINKKPSKTIKEKSGNTIGLVFNNLSENDESTLKEVGFPSFNTSSERFVIPLKYIPADRKIIARYFFNDNGNYNNKVNYFRGDPLSIGKESWDYKYYSESEVTDQRYYTNDKTKWDNLYTPARRADRYYTDANNLRHYVYYNNYGTSRGKIYQYHSLKETEPVITWSKVGDLETSESSKISLENSYYLKVDGATAHFASEINYRIDYREDEVSSWDATNSSSISRSTGSLPSDPITNRYYNAYYYDGWYVKIWKNEKTTHYVPSCEERRYSAYYYNTYRDVTYYERSRVYKGTTNIEYNSWGAFGNITAQYWIYLYVPDATDSTTYDMRQFDSQWGGGDNNYQKRYLSLSNGVYLYVENDRMWPSGITYDDGYIPIHMAMYKGGLRLSATPNRFSYTVLESVYVKAPTITHTYTNTNDIGAVVHYRDEATDNWVRYESVNTWYTDSNQIKYKSESLPEIQRIPKLI